MLNMFCGVRLASECDAAEISRLHLRALYAMLDNPNGHANPNEIDEKTNHIVSAIKRGSIFFVHEQLEEIKGFVCLGRNRDEFEYKCELYSLYVDPAYMRNGIGRRLLARVKSSVKEKGLNSFYLWVSEDNIGARRFYESLGGKVNLKHRVLDEGKFKVVYYWDNLDNSESGEYDLP